jgi:hypothetical protein
VNAAVLLWIGEPRTADSNYCSAALIKGTAPGRFEGITAAHCVIESLNAISTSPIWVTIPGHDTKYLAELFVVGNPLKGHDFARFYVDLDIRMATIPLGDERFLNDGDPVLSIAFPWGIGPSCFSGRILKVAANANCPNNDGMTCLGMIFFDMSHAAGSSGSILIANGRIVGVHSVGNGRLGFATPATRIAAPDKLALLLDKRAPSPTVEPTPGLPE